MYIRIRKNWHITVKDEHTFHLDVREGFIRDRMYLYVDDNLVWQGGIHAWLLDSLRGCDHFEVDGRVFDICWIWNMWTGNPSSIVIAHKGRVIAKFGNDKAMQLLDG